jgi:hypothetical protein
MQFWDNFLNLALESAPWLVLGLILGGLIKNLIPVAFLNKHLRQSSFGSIAKATLFGAPLPLCSCGVVPAAVGLKQAGASRPATTSFLISTPETGVDSLSVTYALLGPIMLVARFISALFSALFTGWLVLFAEKRRWLDADSANAKPTENEHHHEHSCCSHSHPEPEPEAEQSSCCGSCCGSETATRTDAKFKGIWHKIQQGMQFAFGDMLSDIIVWLIVGLVFAAAVQTFVPSDFLMQWGSGILAMLLMLVIGIPMYVCATSSTPIAVGLILAGISPGVALVFLLSGPATNIGTLGVIAKIMGRKTMLLYLFGTIISALAAGLIFDEILMETGWNIVTASQHEEHSLPIWLQTSALVVLAAASLKIMLKKF